MKHNRMQFLLLSVLTFLIRNGNITSEECKKKPVYNIACRTSYKPSKLEG